MASLPELKGASSLESALSNASPLKFFLRPTGLSFENLDSQRPLLYSQAALSFVLHDAHPAQPVPTQLVYPDGRVSIGCRSSAHLQWEEEAHEESNLLREGETRNKFDEWVFMFVRFMMFLRFLSCTALRITLTFLLNLITVTENLPRVNDEISDATSHAALSSDATSPTLIVAYASETHLEPFDPRLRYLLIFFFLCIAIQTLAIAAVFSGKKLCEALLQTAITTDLYGVL